MSLDFELVKAFTREVRQAIGIERTPFQVAMWCIGNLVYPESTMRDCLKHPDMLLNVSNKMRISYLEKSPPSIEWYESP